MRRALAAVLLFGVTLAALSRVSAVNAAVPACSSAQQRVSTWAGEGATGGLLSTATIRMRGGSPCRLHERVIFGLQRRVAGRRVTVPRIDGNPMHVAIDAVLRAGSEVDAPVKWLNWCGGRGAFRWRTRVGGHSATAHVRFTPFCDSPDFPSTLLRLSVDH
jgi:hypothetical protein